MSAVFCITLTSCDTGPGEDRTNSSPVVTEVHIDQFTSSEGTLLAGDQLTVRYTYFDEDGDQEGEPTILWLRDGDIIPGQSSPQYWLTEADEEHLIQVHITPSALSGLNKPRGVISDGVLVNTLRPPAINALRLKGAKITPDFDPDISDYEISAGSLYPQSYLSVAPERASDTIFIDGVAVEENEEYVISDYRNSIEIDVESNVSVSKRKYRLVFSTTDVEFSEQNILALPENKAEYLWHKRFSLGENTLAVVGSGDVLIYQGGSDSRQWVLAQILKGNNYGVEEDLSSAIALESNTLAVANSERNAIYVFIKESGAWVQQARLAGRNTDSGDRFGKSIALEGDTLVVGAYAEAGGGAGVNPEQDGNSKKYSGAAYVYARNNLQWRQEAYLKASNPEAGDSFGWDVAISGETIAVSAVNEDSSGRGVNSTQSDNSSFDSGAVYIFTRETGHWKQQAYIKPHNTGLSSENHLVGQNFGYSIDLSGESLAVGAPFESSRASGVGPAEMGYDRDALFSGAAYIFNRSGGEWKQKTYIKGIPLEAKKFGISVSLENNLLAVGSYCESSVGQGVNRSYWPSVQSEEKRREFYNSGASYLYVLNGSEWTLARHLKASDATKENSFGVHVDLFNEVLAVGSYYQNSDDQVGVKQHGGIYTYSDSPLTD